MDTPSTTSPGFSSTRGHGPVELATALIEGPAPDGGLYLPDRVPVLTGEPAGSALADTATWALTGLLSPPLGLSDVGALLATALDFPVPLVRLRPDTWALELGHGPSGAFKDVGARVLARLLQRLAPSGTGRTRTVLVATSGDTGGAVARAFHGLDGVRVVVLFPARGVSPEQRRVFTTPGGNVRAVAVEGAFDDCQALARAAFRRADLRERHALTSANSLNVGRLLPQLTYYLHAARELAAEEVAPPCFVVPSGNLGNLTAALLASRMGLRHAGLVAALNANDVLRRYLAGEDPCMETPTVATLSNAMDVARPSNLERLRALTGDDRRRLGDEIEAYAVTDAETRRTMARLADEHGYLADPHTAVAFAALDRAREAGRRAGRGPAVVLSTAHPGKFPDLVRDVTGRTPPAPPGLRGLAEGPEHVTTIDPRLTALEAVLSEGEQG